MARSGIEAGSYDGDRLDGRLKDEPSTSVGAEGAAIGKGKQQVDAAAADSVMRRLVAGTAAKPAAAVEGAADPRQLLASALDEPLAAGAPRPAHGQSKDRHGQVTRRLYSAAQYVQIWEAEHGRKMSELQLVMLSRGCIGITEVNLNDFLPSLDQAYGSFEQAHAAMIETNALIAAHPDEKSRGGLRLGDHRAVLFAKRFWSNQDRDGLKRRQPDPAAFLPDPTSGRVDMKGDGNRERPGFENYDYGFWDERTRSFWHANHLEPGMVVYQSTLEKYLGATKDWDRVVFCVALAPKLQTAEQAARSNQPPAGG